MMKKSSNILFMVTLFMSTTMVVMSNNWMAAWMGMEVNLMAFIPMMVKSKNNNSEVKMMYFMVQVMGSMILLMAVLLSPMIMMSPIMINKVMLSMMSISIFIKIGIAPFHMWVPEVMEKTDWETCFLLITWQKIAPLVILSNILFMNSVMMMFILCSVMMGAIGGLNQTSVRKILAYSSINHSGWMTACMMLEHKMWVLYMLIYSIMNLMLIIEMNSQSIFYLNQMNFISKTAFKKMNYSVMMMSLGGLPPFIGFFPKWMVIQSMVLNSMYMSIIIMVMFSLITLFYYLRIVSTMIMINSSHNKWNIKESKKVNWMMAITNMLLPMVLIYSFF